MWSLRTKLAWWVVVLGALLVAVTSVRYFALDPDLYFERQRIVYEEHTLGLMVHIGGMMFALLLGPLQFLRSFRERYFALHRLTGRIYLIGAGAGALGGIYMAQYSASGAVSGVGFTLLGVGVLITGAVAFLRIRAGAVQAHREWMTRCYALIFAAVMLRVLLPGLESVFSEYDAFAIVAWACWVPNLFVAEWVIRQHLRRSPETTLALAT